MVLIKKKTTIDIDTNDIQRVFLIKKFQSSSLK